MSNRGKLGRIETRKLSVDDLFILEHVKIPPDASFLPYVFRVLLSFQEHVVCRFRAKNIIYKTRN